MAKNKKTFNKKQGVKLIDKAAGFLFEEIIETLLKRYRESIEKETMSFEDYCIKLITISREKRGQKGVVIDECIDRNN